MATLPFAIDELTANHLDGLISAEAAEGISLEFKSEPYDHDHEGVREFLKDITSLANTGGGFLLIGVREEQGVAKAITPVTSPDSDKMKQRLESLLQTAVEPRIFGIRIQPVTVPGGYVLAIRVPRSGTPPHRVTAKNSNRFYLRSSAGTYEASMDELRRLFAQDGATRGRLETFLDERIRMISSGKTSVPIESRDRLVLHIIPLAAQGFGNAVNLSRAHELNLKFRTMGNHGGSRHDSILMVSSTPAAGRQPKRTRKFLETALLRL